MPKKYPAEVRERAVRMVLDRLSEYPSVYAACKAVAPKHDVGSEALRAEVRDLKEANEILKAASIFLSSGNSTPAAANVPVH